MSIVRPSPPPNNSMEPPPLPYGDLRPIPPSRVFGFGAILALTGRAAPPQGCSANLEAVRRTATHQVTEIHSSELSADLLRAITTRLHHCTVTLFDLPRILGEPQDPDPIGSGTLVCIRGRCHGILTAHHVADVLAEDSRIGLTVAQEGQEHAFTIPREESRLLEIAVPETKEYGPDIAFLSVPPRYLPTIMASKAFHDLAPDQSSLLNSPPPLENGIWFACGSPRRIMELVPSEVGYREVWSVNQLCFAGPAAAAFTKGEHDYIEMLTEARARDSLPTYKGLSGGGLWQVLLIRSPSGTIEPVRYLLSGLVYFQTDVQDGKRSLRCHGRRSLYEHAFQAIDTQCA